MSKWSKYDQSTAVVKIQKVVRGFLARNKNRKELYKFMMEIGHTIFYINKMNDNQSHTLAFILI